MVGLDVYVAGSATLKKKREPVLLPRFSCHIFRHTFASRFCENEINVKDIPEVMVHADISTTMNIYAEVNESTTRKSLENLVKNMEVFWVIKRIFPSK